MTNATMGTSTLGGVKKQEEPKELKSVQSEKDQGIAKRVFVRFLKWRDNRNLKHEYFRYRTPIEYWDDGNMRFNNYRPRPDWKDDWQSNTSDITTHAKLMAIVSQQVVNQYGIAFSPRLKRDPFSIITAQVLQDIYDFTESGSGLGTRDGDLDLLFEVLQAAKEGTVIGFEGWRKAKNWEGVDARLIPLEDIYPSDLTKFHMEDQQRLIWRSVINKDEFDDKFSTWYQYKLVKIRDNVSMSGNEETSFFNISNQIIENQVEILRYFDKLNDEFFVVANGILIVDPNSAGSKLSNLRKDGELGFWKTVFEVYGPFFYGRSLPDLMQDAQDGIDFLFNAMYDKEILAVMRPLLIGGVNQIIDDYNRPGEMAQVADINQIKEMDYKGADISSLRILEQLQNRQNFVSSIDAPGQGIAGSTKTATEVDRAREAAKRISTLLGTFVKYGKTQKARLRAGTIQQYAFKSDKFKNFITDNTKMFGSGRTGSRTVRITDKPSPSNQVGVSNRLQTEASFMEGGIKKNQIFELSPKQIRDFEYNIKTEAPTEIEKDLESALGMQFYQIARQAPDLFDQAEAAKVAADATKQDYEKVKAKEQPPVTGTEEEAEKPELIPSLQSIISKQGA